MPIRLFNTMTRSKDLFEPAKDNLATVYTCGPTVYNYAHIGNLRTYLFEDVLRRVLEYNGLKVKHVMNVTDVGHLASDADEGEDKIEREARLEGKSAWDIAAYYTKVFFDDLERLNIEMPTIVCRATEHIPEQIAMIEQIEANGYTYRTSDGIYFDTAKLPDYGELARLDIEGLMAGARVEVNPEKRNPTDFALWKFSPSDVKRQMEWESPWGIGFPGWHIECSAMSRKYLGETFDIHCGGVDHIPVHHTNEEAQAQAATGKPLARFWVHGEFLIVGDVRMGKSEGNLLTLQSVVDQGFDPLAYRTLTLTAHYRSKLNFTLDSLSGAQKMLEGLRDFVARLDREKPYPEAEPIAAKYRQAFLEAVNDDLNMPVAMSAVHEFMREINRAGLGGQEVYRQMMDFDRVLGLRLNEVEPIGAAIPAEVQALVDSRQAARKARDFAQADALRNQVRELGYEIEDTPQGPIVKKA